MRIHELGPNCRAVALARVKVCLRLEMEVIKAAICRDTVRHCDERFLRAFGSFETSPWAYSLPRSFQLWTAFCPPLRPIIDRALRSRY